MNALSAKFITSATSLESCPELELPEYAFIGRSNVGKSSLLNMLTGEKGLAKVSATPGHTQLINFFSVRGGWTLVDLPGYGFAQKAKSERQKFQTMIAGYLCGRDNLVCVFVMIDSRHEPQAIDVEFVEFLLEEEVPFALVFSKTDKVKAGRLRANIDAFLARVAPLCEVLPRVFTTSSVTREGRPEMIAFIRETVERVKATE